MGTIMIERDIRIPETELAEHWYSFLHSVMAKLQTAYRAEKVTTGLSQEDIAAKLGKSPASISRWLSGQHNMTMRTMHDLARGMGCRLVLTLEPLRNVRPANRPAYLDRAQPVFEPASVAPSSSGTTPRSHTILATAH